MDYFSSGKKWLSCYELASSCLALICFFVQGPESFVFNPDGSFYTGLADGRIVQVWAPEPSATSSHCATAAATAAAGATAASEASSDASPLSSSGSTCSNIIVAEPRYEVVARTGVEVAGCGTLELEPTCGRPLGMRRLPPSKEKVLHDEKVSTFRQWLKGVKVFGVEAVDYFASLSVLLLLLSTRWEEALSF